MAKLAARRVDDHRQRKRVRHDRGIACVSGCGRRGERKTEDEGEREEETHSGARAL
jgi:hypothetical protein